MSAAPFLEARGISVEYTDRSGNVAFKHKGRVKPAELRAALDAALKDRPQEAGARK